MKYVHSIWSTPSLSNNFDNYLDNKFIKKNFYSYLLSALLIKKLGHTIELYCDEYSYEMYSKIPYDKIHVVDFDSDGVSSKFWIWSKIKTQALINEPYIHIDGDVFLFRDIIGNKMENGNYKAVIQSLENKETIGEEFFNKLYVDSITPFKNINSRIKWDKYGLNAYNCGVVGFYDMKIKNIYVKNAKNLLVEISNNPDFNKSRGKYEGMFLIAEQSLLYYILEEKKVKPLEIIPFSEIKKRSYNWNSYANEIGYAHLLGYSKYKPEMIDKIKFKINKFFGEHSNIIKEFESKYL